MFTGTGEWYSAGRQRWDKFSIRSVQCHDLASTLKRLYIHYKNTPIQIYWEFYHQKIENFQMKNSGSFHISAQNIDCGYLLEPPQRGGAVAVLTSTHNLCFLSRYKKNNVYPCKPQFYYISGVEWGQNYIDMFSWCKCHVPAKPLSLFTPAAIDHILKLNYTSRNMRNVHSDKCAQLSLQTAYAAAQSDPGPQCQHKKLHSWLSIIRPGKILRKCAGWSESSRGEHDWKYVSWC